MVQFIILNEQQATEINAIVNGNNVLSPVPLENGEYFLNADCLAESQGIFANYFTSCPWLLDIVPVNELPVII